MANKEDWKNDLGDEDRQILLSLLNSVKKYRYAYENSGDARNAQLWTALIEMQKRLDKTNELLGNLEEPFRAIVEIGDEEKRKTIEKLVKDVIKPEDETGEDATQKLVDSLMKF
ncbi:MAG: hypothetical protein HYT70_01130 [Candidatus Aenigmarchaeota archaeon]|nr:hypothetical protein [Candidatus Aenigmarchaeota archaeon]